MSSACNTLSPRPAAVAGPISIISADNYLGIQSDHGDGSNRSSREEFVDVENGDGQRPISERDEASHLPLRDLLSSGRPKLIQRTSEQNPTHLPYADHRSHIIVDDHPRGYPQLAAFINSDDNFLMARKYGFLRTRLLLYRQDELSVLEKDLLALDSDDATHRPFANQSRRLDEHTDIDPVHSRKVLMRKIDDKLKEYDDLVNRVRTYASLDAPNSRIIRNLQSFVNWFENHKPLVVTESWVLRHTDDLVSLSDGREYGWLDTIVEDILHWILPRPLMKRLFTSSEQAKKTDNPSLCLYDERRVSHVVRLILVLIIVALLVGPSAVLFFVPGQSTLKICLIMVFTLFFALAMTICTKAKRHEMLAATATYAAVLVVFLGNVNPSGVSS